MNRYYIRQTGYANGLPIGLILNRDNSVYTDPMTEAKSTSETNENLTIVAVDGFNIDINAIKANPRDFKQAKTNLIFTQELSDGTSKVVAALRMRGDELERLAKYIDKQIDDFSDN